MIESPLTIKNKQYLYASVAGVIGIGVAGLLLWSLQEETPQTPPEAPFETHITTAGNRLNPQEMWVERIDADNKQISDKLASLEKMMTENARSIGDVEEKLQHMESECTPQVDMQEKPSETSTSFSSSEAQLSPDGTPHEGSGIRKITLNLSGISVDGKKQEKATLENTLPAGTFAKAILLGGVDASTAVAAPSDPRPVLLRITDPGTLPRKFKSDLKDCHVLASAYGDLSSERVYMRLEKLVCTERLTGEISETQVAGYVLGEDGKAGVRGVVADKAGPVIRNSLWGGFFGGMGKFFESHAGGMPAPFTPFTTGPTLNPKQMLLSGAASGTSQALDKYAEFFIKRAEQLQPVLQVAAGRLVNIVITQGTRFGETSVRQTLSKIRDRSRGMALQNLENQPETHNWLPPQEREGS